MQRTTFQTLPFLKLWIPHFLSRKPIGKSKTIFTAYSFLLLFTVLYNFAKLQTKFERLSSFFKSTVSNTSKWHLCAQVQSWLEFQLKGNPWPFLVLKLQTSKLSRNLGLNCPRDCSQFRLKFKTRKSQGLSSFNSSQIDQINVTKCIVFRSLSNFGASFGQSLAKARKK